SGNASETLGLEKPKYVENLGEIGSNPSVDNFVGDASTKAIDDSTVDPIKAIVPETNVVQDATPSVQTSKKTDDVPDATASGVRDNLENAAVPETPQDVPIPENEKSLDRLVTD
ncbi:hypothetical protein A2U01_0063805, partial [Trifolium medium]|nr:hypothetical protein [Trifolium medium]